MRDTAITNALLINTNCSWNSGSAAQVICTVDMMREHIPGLNFTLLSDAFLQMDKGPCSMHDIEVIGSTRKKPFSKITYLSTLFELGYNVFRCALWSGLKKLNANESSLLAGTTLKAYANSDVILDLSGDTLSDRGAYSIFALSRTLIGIILKKKIVVYSQSIGPFSTVTTPLAKFCLQRTDLIVPRETETLEILREMGIDDLRIHLAPEIAFLLEPISNEKVSQMLAKEGISKCASPLVGLGTNELVYRALASSKESYTALMASIADYLVEKIGAEVVLTPSVFIPPQYDSHDDRFVARQVYQVARNKNKIKVLSAEYSPEELKGIIGQFDLFIGARMHTNIFATSMSVPTVGLGWSHKSYGIMKMIGQEKYCCDFRTTDLNEIIQKINEAWENRDKIKNDLASRMPELYESIQQTGELIKNLVK